MTNSHLGFNFKKFTLITVATTSMFMQSTMANVNSKSKIFNGYNYAGIDATYYTMGFKQRYGGNIFAERFPGVSFSAGHMFNPNLGIEAGYEFGKAATKKITDLSRGSYVLGLRTTPLYLHGNLRFQKVTFKQHHIYLGAIGKYKLRSNIFLSLMGGFAISKMTFDYTIYKQTSYPNNPCHVYYAKNKILPIARIGFEYKLNNKIQLQVAANWKQTSKLSAAKQVGMAGELPGLQQVKPKDTYGISFGLKYYL